MSSELIYFKAPFTGIFSKKNQRHSGYLNYSDLRWLYLFIDKPERVALADHENLKAGDFWYADKVREKKWYRLPAYTTELLITGASKADERVLYTGDLQRVTARDFLTDPKTGLTLIRGVSAGQYELSGTIYFAVPVPKPKKNPEPSFTGGSGNAGRGFNIFRSIPLMGNSMRSAEPTAGNSTSIESAITSDNTPSNKRGCLPRIGNVIGFIFTFGALFYLWRQHTWLAILLLVLSFIWGGLRNSGFRKLRNILGLLLMLFLISFWLFQLYNKNHALKLKQTKKGEVKILPPKEDTENSRTNEKDFLTEKQITWWDFIQNEYKISYQTSSLRFLDVQRGNLAVRNIQGNNEVEVYKNIYTRMLRQDDKYIDSVANIIRNRALEKNLNNIQKAEMVITLIQEIPYYLVHDLSCSEVVAQSSGFVVDYHNEKKPCLPNIPGGLQSPYQFLHNLKGDCDTRSVFGHLLLTKLGISSSVWVSTEYGHSILGVALPVGAGSYKTINGVKHYGVELTAKGFRLGMISPDQRNMNYWNITTYN